MQSKLLAESGRQRTFAIVLETGDEVMSCLKDFADGEQLSAAQFTAIGAFSHAVMAYFDWDAKIYRRNPLNEQVEVAALNGDVALAPDGRPGIHIHAVFGRRDGDAIAGHVVEGHVRPTLEVVLTEWARKYALPLRSSLGVHSKTYDARASGDFPSRRPG